MLAYTIQLKERCENHPELKIAFQKLVCAALQARKNISSQVAVLKKPEEKQEKISIIEKIERRFEENEKIPFCHLCRSKGLEVLFQAFNLDDLCNCVI